MYIISELYWYTNYWLADVLNLYFIIMQIENHFDIANIIIELLSKEIFNYKLQRQCYFVFVTVNKMKISFLVQVSYSEYHTR